MALVVAVVLVRMPFGVSYALVRAVHGRWCVGEVGAGTARRMVMAVSVAARWWPGRAACLEESHAVVLLADALRRRLTWVLGARTDPYRFHAWVETGDQAVLLTRTTADGQEFQRILSV